MANIVFNVAKGEVNSYYRRVATNDPVNSAIVVVLLKTAEADAILQDYATLGDLLAGSNVECDFTNYSPRKVLTDSVITAPSPNNTTNSQSATIPNQTYTSAGGATNNTTAKVIICYDPDTTGGDDDDLIPLTAHDYVVSTTGADMPLNITSVTYIAQNPA